jgi:hypothetical protein
VQYLDKASIDFTLCEGTRPTLTIEYDGLCQGFSHGGVFKPVHLSPIDPNREWKMNFKLRSARDAGYPLIVVSLDEFHSYGDESVHVSIVDGINAHFYASLRFGEQVDEFVARRAQALSHLDASDRLEAISDEAESLELRLLSSWNPLSCLAAEVEFDYYYPDGDERLIGTTG